MDRIVKENGRITIPSSLYYLRAVDEFIEAKLRERGINQSVLTDVAISVTEIVTNAVCHGNKNDPAKNVSISIRIEQEQVTVQIQDQGGGFDPEHLANPLDEKNILKEAGRGIFIVKSLMDEVNFKVVPGSGTVVILVKKL